MTCERAINRVRYVYGSMASAKTDKGANEHSTWTMNDGDVFEKNVEEGGGSLVSRKVVELEKRTT